MCKHDMPTQRYTFNILCIFHKYTNITCMMYAGSFSYPKLETTNPQHMSYSSSSYTLPPPFIPQPKHFLLQGWLCNHQLHCCVICEVKTNDNDQTKEAQGRASGGHLASWNVRLVRRETQAPVRG